MWILESDGDFLQGNRLWLKPGQRYLFGRVKKDGVRLPIEHKSISRKHFVIEVDKVREGDAAHIHARSKVTITDLNSKGGTHLDGKILKNGSQELTKAEHYLKPGSYPRPLWIRWKPVVLTFSFPPKEEKSKDPLRPKRERLEQLDIKTVTEYVTNYTSHVVAAKRNTAKGLQALINGKYIVEDAFVDALVYSATPADLGEEENLSPLEQDFDTAWPNETDYLPKAGKEPTARPAESYAPNPQRESIFEGYTFVFVDQSQYDLLSSVINAGHGKALAFQVTMGETTVEEAVLYMRNAAGDKSFGDIQNEAENGGVVMVRYNRVEAEWKTWFNELLNGVSYALDQRSIDQGEFLDAILANDPTLLRRSLEFASTVIGKVPPPPTTASMATPAPPPSIEPRQTSPLKRDRTPDAQLSGFAPEAPPVSQEAAPTIEEPPKKRSRLRGPAFKRKAFDDEFDADSVPTFDKYDNGLSHDIASQSSIANSRMESEPPGKEEREMSVKRTRSESEAEDEEDMVDKLLPAATAMKRRKMETERQNSPSKTKVVAEPPTRVAKPKKKEKEIDVRELAKQQREAREEAEMKERERLDAGVDEVEHVKPANLVVVEEFELPVRTDRPTRAHGENSDGWDERWNGRKNFKRFRRAGEPGGRRAQIQNVIVPLVEFKQNSYGIGEQYWDKSNDKGSGSKKKGKNAMSHSQSQHQSAARTQTQIQTQQAETNREEYTSPTTTRLRQEAEEIAGAIDVDTPRRTRMADKTHTQSQTAWSSSKRPASGSGIGIGAAKKQKTILTKKISDDDSDSDDLKFRFGRRKKT